MARWFVNPWMDNPKRKRRTKKHHARRGFRGGGEHRPRVHVSGRRFTLGRRSPYKGSVKYVNPIIRNPFIREVGMFGNPRHRHHYYRNRRRHRHNPIIHNPGMMSGAMGAIQHPMTYIAQGGIGAVSAFLTISLPNMLGLFPGPDIMSKVLRGVVRGAAAGLVYRLMKSIAPRQAPAALAGGMIGAGGSFLFDLLGTRLVVGVGDTVQTPGMLFVGLGNLGGIFGSTTATAGYGVYSKPMGAYSKPMGRLGIGGFGGVYGPGSYTAAHPASGVYN